MKKDIFTSKIKGIPTKQELVNYYIKEFYPNSINNEMEFVYQ